MQKRFLIGILILVAILPVASAIPTGAIVYGTSEGIVRSTTLPGENVRIEAQQTATIASEGRLQVIENKIDAFQDDLGSVRSAVENQRTEVTSQLSMVNRELGAIKSGVDQVGVLQQQVAEIKPALEKPQEIIPPISMILLSIVNMVLLIAVIVLIFWLRGQWSAAAKESHVEEHAQIHLTDFVREAMHKGASIAEIRKRLEQRGWSGSKIDEAVQEVRTMHVA